MSKSLFDELNIAAQELFGKFEGEEDKDADTTFVDELQQLNNWRKGILEFSYNLTRIMEQFHSIDTSANKESLRSLIENISKITSIPTKEDNKRIIIRHRGLSRSMKSADQKSHLNNDYVISVGDCVMDSYQLDYLVRFGIMEGGELREKLKTTFDFLQSKNIYIVDIRYNNWNPEDQQTVQDALLAWGQYFTALKKGFGVVLDETEKPDPNLTILAILNKLNLEKFQGMVDKVYRLMIQDKSHKKFSDEDSIYDAIFLIDELKAKFLKSPIEINNDKFIQKWRDCFGKNGRFNRIKFNQHRALFLSWENAFYVFWADLKSVLISEDREMILNCIIRFVADSKSQNEYVDYILKDFYSYPLHLHYSDRDCLFVANLLLFKDYENITYDFGHTPGEILFSNELLNKEAVRQIRSTITDKWESKFLQKHKTIKNNLKSAMKANTGQGNIMPIQLLINIMRELFIFLTLVWDKEFKTLVRDTVKEYANHQSDLYHCENSPEVLLPLLQFFQITILCLVKLGDESDVDLLKAIRNRESEYLSLKGSLQKDYSSHKKLISKIMNVVEEGMETLKKIPTSESNA